MKTLAFALVLAAAAAPLGAGVVYVPVPGYEAVGEVSLEPRILVSNRGGATRSFRPLFLPQDADGTQQGEAPYSYVGAGRTLELTTSAADRGLLQFASAPQLVWAAKLVRPGDALSLGTYLPVLTSKNLFAAGGQVHLMGWQRSADRATDLVLVNLGHTASECAIDVFRADGTQIQSTAEVPMAPLSSRLYEDALGILSEAAALDARAVVSCDQLFFAFSLIRDQATGEVTYLGPGGDGSSTLAAPGEGGGGGGGECPEGALCFTRLTEPYVPSPAESVRRETFEVPTGSYSRVDFHVEVVHGGWKNPTSGLHSLWWLAVERHFRLIGFSGFHGPTKNDILFRHGMNLTAGEKPKFVQPLVATPGETYVCDYVWDPVGRHLEYTVRDGAGNLLLSITDRPNVNRLHVEEGENLVADFSTGIGWHPEEPPTYGWQYKNLTLVVYP